MPALSMTRTWAQSYEDVDLRTYRPHFYSGTGDDLYLNETHANMYEIMHKFRGGLAFPDYFKLYEIGYYAQGPVLEIGRLAGKSTSIIAMGMRDGEKEFPFFSVDQAAYLTAAADATLQENGVRERVLMLHGDSADTVQRLPGRFDTVFIDGDHSYDGVVRDMFAIRNRVEVGSPILFHDYYHGANADPANLHIKVAKAVDKHAPGSRLEFRGGVGAIAVFEQR